MPQRGIAAYARAHGPWSFYQQLRAMHDTLPDWLKQQACEGILARIESPKLIEQIRKVNLPTVDLLGIHELEGIPTVSSDHEAVAGAAADELLGRAFRRFAFCGFPGLKHSDRRCHYFVERLAAEGFETSVYQPARLRRPTNISTTLNRGLLDEEDVAAWLSGLPKPVGLMAPNDVRAATGAQCLRGAASPCPTKWPSSAWTTMKCFASSATRRYRASTWAAKRSAVRRRWCWIG